MSADIGIKLYADGEKQFKTALSNINAQIKNLNSEMRLVASEFEDMEAAEDGAAKKTDILARSVSAAEDKVKILSSEYERNKQKLEELEKNLQEVNAEFGANSTEASKAANAYNRQATKVSNLSTQINNAQRDLNKFQAESRDAGKAIEDLGDDIDDAGDSGADFGNVLMGVFTGGAIVAGIKAISDAIFGLVDNTMEYRSIMGSLEVSSTNAGYTAEQTAEAYNRLYGVLGDTQTTATTVANLQAMGLSQTDLIRLIDGATGAWATYGDSIPIDGLAEAINETVRVGQVTGTFADVLNWAGTSEDAFNEKLASANDETERAQLVLDELANQGLVDAAESWREVNANVVATNEAQSKLDANMARLGDVMAPAVNRFRDSLGDVVGKFAELLENGSPLISLFAGLAAGIAALAIAKLIADLGGLAGVLSKVTTAVKAVNAAMAANPLLLVISLIAAVVTALITAYNTNEEFRAKVDEVWASVKEVISTVVGAITAVIKTLVDGIKALGSGIVEVFSALPEQVVEIGKNIVRGLWDGITSMVGWIKDKIVGFGNKILEGFKDVFQIHSPSRLMRDSIGKAVAEGVAVGIEENAGLVTGAVRSLKDRVLDMANGVDFFGIPINASVSVDLNGKKRGLTAEQLMGLPVGQTSIAKLGLGGENLAVESAESNIKKIATAGKELQETSADSWKEVAQNIENATREIAELLAGLEKNFFEFGDKMLEFFGKTPNDFKNIGKDMIRGLWTGMNSMREWIFGRIAEYTGEIITTFANAVGEPLRGLTAKSGADVRMNMGTGIDVATNSGLYNATEALVNGLQGVGVGGQIITVPLYLDGRKIAEATFNPLQDVAKQRGVSLG